jgi:hypothetical protein
MPRKFAQSAGTDIGGTMGEVLVVQLDEIGAVQLEEIAVVQLREICVVQMGETFGMQW